MIAINQDTAIAFTGHRLLEDDRATVKNKTVEILERYISSGFDTFLCGMAIGYDLLCGEAVIELKQKHGGLKLVCCIPYKNSDKYYSKKDKELFERIIENSDENVILSPNYYNGCFHARDKFMVDNACVIVAYKIHDDSGTGFTAAYGAMQGKKVLNVKDLL